MSLELLFVILALFAERVEVIQGHRAGISNENLAVIGNWDSMIRNGLEVDIVVVYVIIGFDLDLIFLVLPVLIRNGVVLLNGLVNRVLSGSRVNGTCECVVVEPFLFKENSSFP